MTGLPELNFPAFFEAEKRLREVGFEVINPADRAGRTKGKSWDWYLRQCIKDMLEAEGLAMLPQWYGSKGANLEHHLAAELNMPIRTVEEWLESWAAVL